jgi:predicted nucleic acid-binding protein
MNTVCIDAGLMVKLVSREPDSDLVDSLFAVWREQHVRMVAPCFFAAEVDSVLRQKVMLRGELTEHQADTCFAAACRVPVEPVSVAGQRERAWNMSMEFGMRHVYDAVYLALAELLDCDFWTADAQLYRTVRGSLPFVQLLGQSLGCR